MKVLLCQCVNEPFCDRHPLRVRENAAFLVNVDSYNNWEDIKDDMNGAYTKPLRCGTWTVECQKNDNGETDIKLVARKALPLTKNSQYHLLIFLTVSIQRLRSTTFGVCVCVMGGGGGFAIFERDTQKQFSCFRAITSIITNRFVPALLGTQAAFRLHSV